MKKYDADTIIHYIAIARELAYDALELALLLGSLAALWFIGCALA